MLRVLQRGGNVDCVTHQFSLQESDQGVILQHWEQPEILISGRKINVTQQ
jgi:hypothetical protein